MNIERDGTPIGCVFWVGGVPIYSRQVAIQKSLLRAAGCERDISVYWMSSYSQPSCIR